MSSSKSCIWGYLSSNLVGLIKRIMEHLQSFLEHQRKFKSSQVEKQKEIDALEAEERRKEEEKRRKEEEERRKSYTTTYYGGRGSYYGDARYNKQKQDWSENRGVSTTLVTIYTQKQRIDLGGFYKIYYIHEEALLDLFPGIDVRKLPEAVTIIPERASHVYGFKVNKDYDILIDSGQNYNNLINDQGHKVMVGINSMRRYKKYNFGDVYASLKRDVINLTVGSYYKIIGETEYNYEITDDIGDRRSYPKNFFSLPCKKSKSGGYVISKTEARGDFYNI